MMAAADDARLAALPGLPRDEAGPVFAQPWQAHAFALTVALHERGAFTWPEWAAALGQAIAAAQAAGDADLGDTYYRHWVDALEALVLAKRIGSADVLHALEHAWADAARRTPHGQPVVLPPAAAALAGGGS
ncbi:MAG: nitrile hydratase accessory protein [Rubrivivax sp.]|jgi:nitrile hydratase accessory protein|nr:nitrile hydratase accessory protein [Rubrivivax sp.]